jgi:hypothetical protein
MTLFTNRPTQANREQSRFMKLDGRLLIEGSRCHNEEFLDTTTRPFLCSNMRANAVNLQRYLTIQKQETACEIPNTDRMLMLTHPYHS